MPGLLATMRLCGFVSIRARHCWRAMPAARRAERRRLGVSIRARHCWRAMPALAHFVDGHPAVSIRARHCWRAMPRHYADGSSALLFQSAPAIAGGRCHARIVDGHAARCFNPRPPLLAGDASGRRTMGGPHAGFNPRPPLLAGDASGAGTSPRLSEFQSAPAIAGGRCPILAEHLLTAPPVSIRARHCWRAMPVLRRRGDAGRRFQSAPAIAGGRCRARRGR